MRQLRRIAVLGAGNGGQTMAADLALAGFEVNLFELPQFGAKLEPVRAAGGLTLSGIGRNGFGKLRLVTTDPAQAVKGADLVMVASTVHGHQPIIEAVGPHLEDGQVVVFNTGYWAGPRFQPYLKGLGKEVILGETTILVYLCVITGPAQVRMDGYKNGVHVAGYPGKYSDEVYDLVKQAYPTFVRADSVLETNMENINWIFHPAIIFMNTAVIERTKGDFVFYVEGVTPRVANVVEAVDRERLALCSALGIKMKSSTEWLNSVYGAPGKTLYEAIKNNPAYKPSRYTHVLYDLGKSNFITEDVPYGMVPVVSMAEQIGLETPTLRSLIHLISVMNGEDYWGQGLKTRDLGLEGLDAKGIVNRMIHGE